MIVYLLTNSVNGKRYVGQTTKSLNWRFGQHRRNAIGGRKTYLYNAIRKYGVEVFIPTILETCLSLEDLDAAEKKWIEYYRALDRRFGYNECEGGRVNRMTPEMKERRAAKLRGRKHTEEHKRKIGLSSLGRISVKRKLSDEDVVWIKSSTLSQKEVAKIFKVDPSTISRVKAGKSGRVGESR